MGKKVPETVATFGALAIALGLQLADPVRALQKWHERGMPGRPGSRGKADGEWNVAECRAWIETHVRQSEESELDSPALKRELLRLDLEIKLDERREQLGRLADVDEVGRFNEQAVNDARAILEAIPDEVVRALPEEIADQVRALIHRRVEQLVRDACDHVARQVEGDDDLVDDRADKPSTPPTKKQDRARVAAKGKRRPGGVGRDKGKAERTGGRKGSVRSGKPAVVARTAARRR